MRNPKPEIQHGIHKLTRLIYSKLKDMECDKRLTTKSDIRQLTEKTDLSWRSATETEAKRSRMGRNIYM